MVHTKDDINADPFSDEEDKASCYDEEGVCQPEWTIDDDGIPYCKSFSEYEKMISLNMKKRFPREFEKMMHCERCDHYKNDDCYFPKAEIEKIELDRRKVKHNLQCQLCGMKIDRPWSIFMSQYYKKKHKVNLPLICCTCYASLEKKSFLKNARRRIVLFSISLATSIYFIASNYALYAVSTWYGFMLFLVPFLFWGYFSVRDIKSIFYLQQGKKYYRKIMEAQAAPREVNLRDKYMDDEDKKKPEEDNYYSPGYT